MAYLPRLVRFNHLKNYVTVVRHITSNNVPVVSTTSRISALFNNALIKQVVSPNNSWIWQQNDKVESPLKNKLQIIDLPNGLKYVPPLQDPQDNKELELPTTPDLEIPKEAVRMIVIRRKKMKRHKLRKLRKRMKFEWAKRRQKREWNKEKLFTTELIKQCKDGEAFSAEKYVEERLAKLSELKVLQSEQKKQYWK